jgi:hypothetical protein
MLKAVRGAAMALMNIATLDRLRWPSASGSGNRSEPIAVKAEGCLPFLNGR